MKSFLFIVSCVIISLMINAVSAFPETLKFHYGDKVKYKPSEFMSKVCDGKAIVVGVSLQRNPRFYFIKNISGKCPDPEPNAKKEEELELIK